jgi:hypothetical protein
LAGTITIWNNKALFCESISLPDIGFVLPFKCHYKEFMIGRTTSPL